jgi:VanZ family protein
MHEISTVSARRQHRRELVWLQQSDMTIPMTILINPRLVRLAKVAFWLALTLAFVLAVLPKPPKTPIDQFGDKAAHVLAFATLSSLAMIGFGRAARWRIVERLSFVGAIIEVVQSLPLLHRDCDVRDWIADTLAVLVMVLLFSLIMPRGETAAR